MRNPPHLALHALLWIGVALFGMGTAGASPLDPSGRWTLQTTGYAPTPPMGWNSWNAFGTGVTEEKVMGIAQVIVDSGLRDLGYRYINIDDGWWLKRRAGDGRLLIRTSLFPSAGDPETSSFKPFTTRLHAMGLKAGIYSDIGRNACSQAYAPDNPNLPEGSLAEREVGLYGHARQDLMLYFDTWGFDYIKVDACGLSAFGPSSPLIKSGRYRATPRLIVDQKTNRSDIAAVQELYGAVRLALNGIVPSGRFVLSLCNWGAANVRSWGKDFGTQWRTSNDIDPTWDRMVHNFDSVATREFYSGPGHWNDPDMLEIGNGAFDASHLVEARTHLSLWAMVDAPLIMGYDLRKASPELLAIFGAPEVVGVNQDPAGHQAVLAFTSDQVDILVKSLSRRGEKAVALFNRTAEPVTVQLTAAHLKMHGDRPVALRDLWSRREVGDFQGEISVQLGPHETRLFKATGAPQLDAGQFISETPAIVNVAVDGIPAPEADPQIHRMLDPYQGASTRSGGTRPLYAGWGAPRADSTPYNEELRIGSVLFRSGIGVLANSRLEVKTDGAFRTFKASVGIDDSTRGRRAAVRFEVWGDGRLLIKSSPRGFDDPALPVQADISGVQVVELIVRQLGPDVGNVVTTWGDARLTP